MIQEVVRGKRIQKNRNAAGDKILGRLFVELMSFSEDVGSGLILQNQPHSMSDPSEFLLKPDIAFHWSVFQKGYNGYVERPPDLVIECFYPEDHIAIINDRMNYYVKEGSVVWSVNSYLYQIGVRKYAEPTKLFNPGDILKDELLLPGFSFKIPNP